MIIRETKEAELTDTSFIDKKKRNRINEKKLFDS